MVVSPKQITKAFLDKIFAMFQPRVETLEQSIQAIIVREELGDKIDFERAVVTLPQPMSRVKVYFNREASRAYKDVMDMWFKYHKNGKPLVFPPLKGLERLIVSNDKGRIVTYEDILRARKSIEPFRELLDDITPRTRLAFERFTKENQEIDLVDHVTLNLYAPVTEVPYLRIHNAVFRKSRIYANTAVGYLRRNTHILDRLVRLANRLSHDANEVGEGEEYEIYRLRQHQLMEILNRYTDYLEEDIHNLEIFIEAAQTTLSVKIYDASDES